MEYYSALKNNGIMPFAATWMDLEIALWWATEAAPRDFLPRRAYYLDLLLTPPRHLHIPKEVTNCLGAGLVSHPSLAPPE